MEFVSIGIGILSVSSTLLIKCVGYIRRTDRSLAGLDRAMAELAVQLKSHVDQSQAEMREIRAAIDRLESRIEEVRGADGSDY